MIEHRPLPRSPLRRLRGPGYDDGLARLARGFGSDVA